MLDQIRIKTRETLNPYLAPLRRKKLKTEKFTIISNNCWGGMFTVILVSIRNCNYIKFTNEVF